MGPIVIDARDAASEPVRGWGRYTRELVAALVAEPGLGLDLLPVPRAGRGPEFVFEQAGLPLLLWRRSAALVHAPNCFLPLLRPCPGVVTIHDLAFEAWPQDFPPATRIKFQVMTRLAARSAERIICPSQFTAQDVCRRYGVDSGKLRVIPEAPALVQSTAWVAGEGRGGGPAPHEGPGGGPAPAGGVSCPGQSPYVVAVGDLRRKKNLGPLVRAYVALRRREGIPHRLVLAGVDSGEGPRLRELAAGEPVQLTGYLDDARLDGLIRGAELLVHPSLYEGFGLVVLEAMARGTPVLAARATALPETGSDAAEYFDPAVPDDLERRLSPLLADGERRGELARRGRLRASQFSWSTTALRTADVYRELL